MIEKNGVLFLCILSIILIGKSNAVGKDARSRSKIKLSSDTNNREDNLYGKANLMKLDSCAILNSFFD